jgi:Putative prokaryotic signal transducing protein
MKLVEVYKAANETEARTIHGFLASNSIKSIVEAESSGPPIGGMFPTGGTTLHLVPWSVSVPAEKVDEAKRLLSEFRTQMSAEERRRNARWVIWTKTFLNVPALLFFIIVVLWLLLHKWIGE